MAPSGGAPNTPPNGPPPSDVHTSPNVIAFDPKHVTPSQTVYFQRNDSLGFFFFTNINGLTARINYRWLTPDGEIKEGQLNTPPIPNVITLTVPLYEGWLISLAGSIIGAPVAGQYCHVQVVIFRGIDATGTLRSHENVWSGYLYSNSWNGWPGVPAKEITDGPGIIRSVTGTTPAAGAEISETVPANRRWTLLALRASLTTSVTVANRFPGFLIDDGVNSPFAIRSSVAEAASAVNFYSIAPGNQFYNDTTGFFLIPFPTLSLLKAGFRIRSNTVALQVGDQWSAPQYFVQEWGAWDA